MRADVLRGLVAEAGGTLTVDTTGAFYTLRALAPEGQAWRSDGLHEIVESTNGARATWRALAREAMIERVAMGLEPCSDPECERCHPEP